MNQYLHQLDKLDISRLLKWRIPITIFVNFVILLSLNSCDPEIIEDPPVDNRKIIVGTLEFDFEIKHQWLPVNRIVRVALHLGESANHIYRGDYFISANVTDNKQIYRFNLSPGTYYFEAIIACICEGDSCSGGGFPGNQYGMKHTMGKFSIIEDERTLVKPDFNR